MILVIKYRMSRDDNIFFAKRNLADNIYSSARLEGVAITFPETAQIVNEGRNVARLTVEEVLKVNNLKHAWQFVLDTIDYPIDLMYIRQLNKEEAYGTQTIRISDPRRRIDNAAGDGHSGRRRPDGYRFLSGPVSHH